MKLWHKIFLCMFVLSLGTVGIYGTSLNRKNHLENLEREMERSSSEMDLLSEAVSAAAQSLGSAEAAVKWYSSYYKSRGIYFTLFEEGKQVYASGKRIPGPVYGSMMEVSGDEKMMFVQRQDSGNYFMTSKMLDEEKNQILFYIRNIDELYETRERKQNEFTYWMAGFSMVMALASYAVAKVLTRPLAKLKKNAQSINNGIYQVRCREGKDEIGRLGSAFNAMTRAVEEREQNLISEAEKKQQFIDAMTHEMNTPLTSIQGYAQFLRNANCTPAQREKALQSIESEARRMHAMYGKLRTLQLMRNEPVVSERIFVAKVISEVRQELDTVLKEKQILLKEELQGGYLEGDGVLLHILLSNLIRNSVNYSPAGSLVIVSLWAEAGKCILSVRDFGCGIPAESLDKVAEPYYRVDKSRSRATGGSGIGLYLCLEIMRQQGGEMKILSEEGKGTEVRLVFPERKKNLQS